MTALRATLDNNGTGLRREHLETLALAQLAVVVLALVAMALQAT